MVQPVIQSLIDFSNIHNLRQTTIKYGVQSLKNWMKEYSDEYSQLFSELIILDFTFEDVSQQLIFFQHGSDTFVLRTRYSIFTNRQKDKNKPVGWYALDVNENREAVDDWLVFE